MKWDHCQTMKKILVEKHWISRELANNKKGSAVYISSDQLCSVMVNEEDHLRIQFFKENFNLKSLWKRINLLDDELESSLSYAFSKKYGYLTACPSNLGTGLRASVMMHLPGLYLSNNIDKVIKASNQLGLAVRGIYGEGTDASGHIYQISNQQTLGEAEGKIIGKLADVLRDIIQHELKARVSYYEKDKASLIDLVSRAKAVLSNSYLIATSEAMDHLSYIRLAVDMGFISDEFRKLIDYLFIQIQPGHIEYPDKGLSSTTRDFKRAELLRNNISKLPHLNFDK